MEGNEEWELLEEAMPNGWAIVGVLYTNAINIGDYHIQGLRMAGED